MRTAPQRLSFHQPTSLFLVAWMLPLLLQVVVESHKDDAEEAELAAFLATDLL